MGRPELVRGGWDAAGGISRARGERPNIVASNVDLLLRLGVDCDAEGTGSNAGVLGGGEVSGEMSPAAPISVEEIQFQAPRVVGKIAKEWSNEGGDYLGPNQVESEYCRDPTISNLLILHITAGRSWV